MEPILVAGAIVGSTALVAGALWAAWRYTRPFERDDAAPVKLEIVEDEHPATFIAGKSVPTTRAKDTRGTPRDVASAPPVHAGTRVPATGPSRPVLAPPPPGVLPPRGHAERAPAMVLTQGVQMQDAASASPPGRPFVRAPAPRPPMRDPPPMKSWAQQVIETTKPEVPTEWARRQVGLVEPGRTAGACGGCGARLSVSNARPLRIACPVCGRTKLLAS